MIRREYRSKPDAREKRGHERRGPRLSVHTNLPKSARPTKQHIEARTTHSGDGTLSCRKKRMSILQRQSLHRHIGGRAGKRNVQLKGITDGLAVFRISLLWRHLDARIEKPGRLRRPTSAIHATRDIGRKQTVTIRYQPRSRTADQPARLVELHGKSGFPKVSPAAGAVPLAWVHTMPSAERYTLPSSATPMWIPAP